MAAAAERERLEARRARRRGGGSPRSAQWGLMAASTSAGSSRLRGVEYDSSDTHSGAASGRGAAELSASSDRSAACAALLLALPIAGRGGGGVRVQQQRVIARLCSF